MAKIQTIGVLTSGGDAPGMNAAIRAVTRAGICNGFTIKGIYRGWEGLINGDIKTFTTEDVSGIINQGGTILRTARSEAFRTYEGREKAYETMQREGIDALVVIGGNGTLSGAKEFAEEFDVCCVGLPGTIDNDLYGTDHCPGFASAAKYIATSFMEVSRDCHVYDVGMITIIECMGRHAGWLTAAASLANLKGDGPDLVYLPEVDFDMDRFLADVKRVYAEKKNCLVAVSEGVHYADGSFVSEAKTSGTDGFGHAQLGGLAARLAAVVKAATGAKVRGIELSLLQRCASHCASATDIEESFNSGKIAVESALAGVTDKMVGFQCDRKGGYKCNYVLFDLGDVANAEQKVPLSWINEEHNGVTQDFVDYCLPLIQGETKQAKVDGLPDFVQLKKVFAK